MIGFILLSLTLIGRRVRSTLATGRSNSLLINEPIVARYSQQAAGTIGIS